METWAAMKSVIKVRTFQIIVLQGVVGMLPWTAMVFFTMWFELIGEFSIRHFHRGFLESRIEVFLQVESLGCEEISAW